MHQIRSNVDRLMGNYSYSSSLDRHITSKIVDAACKRFHIGHTACPCPDVDRQVKTLKIQSVRQAVVLMYEHTEMRIIGDQQ